MKIYGAAGEPEAKLALAGFQERNIPISQRHGKMNGRI